MEKFERNDRRFILACLAVIAVGAVLTGLLFHRAFPEASIEFRVNRSEARVRGEKFLQDLGRNVAGTRFAGRFDAEEEAKVYLERELGLEQASRFYGTDAKVWRWKMRWFRSAVKEEERVEITPRGDLAGYESVRKEDAPGAHLSSEQAREVSRRFLEKLGFPAASLKSIEVTPVTRPRRTDWTFVDERTGFRMKDATVRYATTVAGSEVIGFREFVHVPESWSRDYRRLRAKNETAGTFATFGLFLTFVAMLGVLVAKISRKDVPWKLVAAFGGIACLLALLSALNGIPLSLYDYETNSPLSSYLTREIVLGILGAIATGAGIAVVVASSEPIYRERFPRHLSLSGMFSRRGLRTKRFFLGVLLGYALTAFFFAYQAVFYVVAARFGAWAPADIPYSDMLNTAFPWATVLLIGFLPAVSEEGISRMFSISFLDKLGAGRVIAVVLPALIWGFGHSAYPNQPFYIRGVEVGVAGILMGILMLRYGVLPLLVWHFTVDATYTALLLLRSGNAYYVLSGVDRRGHPAAAARCGARPLLPEGGIRAGDGPDQRRRGLRADAAGGASLARGGARGPARVGEGPRLRGRRRGRPGELLLPFRGRAGVSGGRPDRPRRGRESRAALPAVERRRPLAVPPGVLPRHRVPGRRGHARRETVGAGRNPRFLRARRAVRAVEGGNERLPAAGARKPPPGVLGRALLPAREEGGVEGLDRRGALPRRGFREPPGGGRAGRAAARRRCRASPGPGLGWKARVPGPAVRGRRRRDAGPSEAHRHDRGARSGSLRGGRGAAPADRRLSRGAPGHASPVDPRPRQLPARVPAAQRRGLASARREGRRHRGLRGAGSHPVPAPRARRRLPLAAARRPARGRRRRNHARARELGGQRLARLPDGAAARPLPGGRRDLVHDRRNRLRLPGGIRIHPPLGGATRLARGAPKERLARRTR